MAVKVNKSCPVSCRLTDDQYSRFTDPIAQSGLKPARFFRDLVMSRSPTFKKPAVDKTRMLQVFEKSGHALNRVAYLANSAPYSGALYQKQYLRWLNRLNSIQLLLHTVVNTTDPPSALATTHNGNRGSPGPRINKTHTVRFRLSQDELAQFDQMIKQAGCNASVFFRELILNKTPTFSEFTGFKKKIVFIVNKSGNNITQLAYIARAAFERGIIAEVVKDKWLVTLVTIEALLLAGIAYVDQS